MDDALLEAHAQLRRATYRRHPGYVDSEAATESIRAYLRPIHEEGRVAVHEEAGRVTAVLAWRHQEDAWVGEPVSQVAMDLESAPEHFRAATLDAELPRMEADLDLMLDAHHRATLEALLARGLGVDSIQLLGEPTRARAKLEARPLPPGITVTPLEARDVEATLALHRETFAREPVYCWFGANPGFLASFEERLRSDREGHFVVRRDGAFAGHVSAAVKESPFWGRAAGMDLVLAPALRGRGLLRGLYASLLDSMIEAEARVFKGGTSQPPVLRLAREMDRTLFAIHLRRGATLPHAAFEGYL
ncbi:MAG: hypothetical protein RID81_12950 [Sandaracinaceae bacterium]